MAEISDESWERLRQILVEQNGKNYTIEEAKEIGEGLLDFFRLLLDFTDNKSFDCPNSPRATPESSGTLQQYGSGAAP